MRHKPLTTYLSVLLTPVLFILFVSSSFAGPHKVRLIISAKKANYSKIESFVKDLGGEVHIKHNLTEAMAVSLAPEKVQELSAMAEVERVVKDVIVELPKPRQIKKQGFEALPLHLTAEPDAEMSLSTDQTKQIILAEPTNYDPYTNDLTNALDFSINTGHIGEDVIIGVIDAGVAPVSSLAGRVIGGENFTNDGISANSFSNDYHGTFVATCIGASAVFGFFNPAVQNAVKEYAPNSVIPGYFAPVGFPDIDGIPMFGAAPGAVFFALKVFKADGSGSPRSVIAAGLERAIELKQKANNGEPDGLNIQIVNMSLGGANLFTGNDQIYSPLVELANEVGILLVVSAGNEGPSGMTIGSPGDSKNILTVGATSDATHERIVAQIFFNQVPGGGYAWRPVDNHIVADFSSRGPNPDGRNDPDIVAPGDWRFGQMANGDISWSSGTSFSAPTVAGAAALLLSAEPGSTPDQLRGALLYGANKSLLDDKPQNFDQGYGFLDVTKAFEKLQEGVSNPPDIVIGTPIVPTNLKLGAHINAINRKHFSRNTDMLLPGQRVEYFYGINHRTKRVTVTISNVQQELPPEEQNQLFTDDLIVAIHSAKTSGTNDYRQFAFVGSGGGTFVLEGSDLDYGIARITIMGDWTNAGKVGAQVDIASEYEVDRPHRLKGTLSEGESDIFEINVPDDASQLKLHLSWLRSWGRYPTNDLDLLVFDPDGNLVLMDNDLDGDFDGLSWDAPEMLAVPNPAPGTWVVLIDGFTIWNKKEVYRLFADITRQPALAAADKAIAIEGISYLQSLVPSDFAMEQNYPNPFNPTTTINYQIPKDSYVTLRVYDIQGRLVRSLVNEQKAAGFYASFWDGHNNAGQSVPSGTYIYQISAGDFRQTNKMMLLK